MSKLKMGFLGLSVPNQIERSRLILGKVNGNPYFPMPDPTTADGTTITDALEIAFNDSRSRDKDKMAIMRLRRKDLLDYHRRLSAYVQAESGGDEEIILSSGYDVVRRGEPLEIGQVLNVRTKPGIYPGSIHVIWDKTVGAGAYLVEISSTGPVGESFTLYKVVLKTRIDITGLNPGGLYWVRISAVGRVGYGLPSDPSPANTGLTY